MTHHVQLPSTIVGRVITPASLDDALAAVARPGSRPIAGGTDLLIELARGEHDGLDALVDLTRVPGLGDIVEEGGTVSIGALVTHNRIVADPMLRQLAAPLVQACREVGSPQLRNRATVAGNLVTASPANDTISALLALEATVEVASVDGRRRIPLGEFHPGIRRTALRPGELVTAVSFPALVDGWRGLYLKLGLRRAQAISVVHLAAAARFEPAAGELPAPPTVGEIRLAIGSVAPVVVRAGDVEDLVQGTTLDDGVIRRAAELAAAGVQPIDDVRATAEYRRRLVAEMTARVLRGLRDDAGVVDDDPVVLWGGGDGRWPTGDGHGAEHGVATPVRATVDGEPVAEPMGHGTLLDWLRRAGRTGTKEGCAEGECGSCTICLDGQAVLSCLVPAARANGTEITTVEGLAGLAGNGGSATGEPLHRLQETFVEAGAVQCGYCIPGFLVAGATLLEERPNPTEPEIVDGLAGNLCRCTGYYKIVEAMLAAGGGSSSGNGERGS
ncbi:MAG: FAD binding domain-containing protein [Actinomycetota bacterium]